MREREVKAKVGENIYLQKIELQYPRNPSGYGASQFCGGLSLSLLDLVDAM